MTDNKKPEDVKEVGKPLDWGPLDRYLSGPPGEKSLLVPPAVQAVLDQHNLNRGPK